MTVLSQTSWQVVHPTPSILRGTLSSCFAPLSSFSQLSVASTEPPLEHCCRKDWNWRLPSGGAGARPHSLGQVHVLSVAGTQPGSGHLPSTQTCCPGGGRQTPGACLSLSLCSWAQTPIGRETLALPCCSVSPVVHDGLLFHAPAGQGVGAGRG